MSNETKKSPAAMLQLIAQVKKKYFYLETNYSQAQKFSLFFFKSYSLLNNLLNIF